MYDPREDDDDDRSGSDDPREADRDDEHLRREWLDVHDLEDRRWDVDPRTDDADDRRDRENDFRKRERAREREVRERWEGPREVFTRDVDLPRGLEREPVVDRDREYRLRGSESRTLATVGAFRLVPASDLRDAHGRAGDPRSSDLRHLRQQGLVETVRLTGRREVAVVLTPRGRDVLEARRQPSRTRPQEFYAGLKRAREAEHDAQVFRAYAQEAERLQGERVLFQRVVLDYELKSAYQRWLHARERGRSQTTGRPRRSTEEIREWAADHRLPYFDERVHFPDARIEYWHRSGKPDHVDLEIVTPHYRGSHGAATARTGFTRVRGTSASLGGRRGGRSTGRGLAEELLK